MTEKCTNTNHSFTDDNRVKRRDHCLSAMDIFSGCGGLTLGLKRAGFRIIGAVDVDPAAVETYRANHQKVKVWERDIRDLAVSEIMSCLNIKEGGLDLLAGCPPCQGFSRMRTRNGPAPVDDERNDLLFEFVRLLEGLLPKSVMIENVPGLMYDWRMAKTYQKLGELGYRWDCNVVDAADYGVPQRRRRMILMASRLGNITIPNRKYKRRSVWHAIGDIPTPTKSRKALHRLLAKHGFAVQERIKRIPKDGGSRLSLGMEEQLPCHKKNQYIGFKDVYGRMAWDKVAPTLTRFCVNPSKGRFLHPEQDRAITLYEAALLQSFPRSYKFPTELGRGAIASMIGEALPPLLAERQARHLLKHLRSVK